jgi:hypothetical protein
MHLGIHFAKPASSCPKAEQGDQIGRIFAYWAIAYFGQLFEI